MKDRFLPKALDRAGVAPLCIDRESGALSTEMHWHDCAEIIHLERGWARLFSKDGWAILGEGETALIPKGEAHCCHCTDKDAVRIVIGLSEELIGGSGALREQMTLPFRQGYTERRIFSGSERLTELFSLLFKSGGESLSERLRRELTVGLIYSELLSVIESKERMTLLKPRSEAVKRIERFIEDRYSEPISVLDAAAEVNLSYSHTAKLLRDECKMSFGEMLLTERIKAAKRLLLTTDMSITDIGIGVGFTDASYFIKRFGERVGLTPYRYREDNLSVLYK